MPVAFRLFFRRLIASRPVAPCLAAVLTSLVAGCGHVPVSTLYHLRNFDLSTFDPSMLRVAVQLDDKIEPLPGGTLMRIAAWRKDQPEGKQEHDFVLLPIVEKGELSPLIEFAKPGQRIHAFRVAPTDFERIRAMQEAAQAAKAKGTGQNMLTIAVEPKLCRRGDLSDRHFRSSTLVRTDPLMGYLVLLKDVDLKAEAKKAGKDVEVEIPPCK